MTASVAEYAGLRRITVKTESPYEVLIGRGLLDSAGEQLRALAAARRAAIISDDNVFPLYGSRLEKSLRSAGIAPSLFLFRHGEESKSLQTYGEILEFLCKERMTRADAVIALGGGVTGDLSGFAASTYQRGMDFIQIPTTLLADVDSSVGGKTAVNLSGGKNQAGSFYQPRLVLIDTQALYTLPKEEYINGCAEVIKYALLSGAEMFKSLKNRPVMENYEDVIARCIAMKRDIVEKDERDAGVRALLNLGHTFGHAVEKLSSYSIPHGQAVAMGMAMIARAAAALGYCEEQLCAALTELLHRYELPCSVRYPAEDIARACLNDKKLLGGCIRLVVPRRLGKCDIIPVPAEKILDWAKAGIE